MFRQMVISVAMVAATASSADAGFTFGLTRSAVSPQFDRILWSAVNDGVGTGTGVQALTLNAMVVNGTFRITASADEDGNLYPNLRPGPGAVSPTATTTRYHGFLEPLPTGAPTMPQGNSFWGLPWTGSSGAYLSAVDRIVHLGVARPVVPNSDPVIAAFVVPTGANVNVHGSIGGTSGNAAQFNLSTGGDFPPYFNYFQDEAIVRVDYGQQPSSPSAEATFMARYVDDVPQFSLGAIPPQLAGRVSLGPPRVTQGAVWQDVRVQLQPGDTSLISWSRSYFIDVFADDANPTNGRASGRVEIRIVPEPTTLGLVAGACLLTLRRR
jgi:hypothetical protein